MPSLHGRTQVICPEDLVWPPPLEDLQAFSVIKVGEDDEHAASRLILAGVAAVARPLPRVPAPAPAPTPAAAPVPTWPRHAVMPGDVAPARTPIVSSRSMLLRWAWLGLFAAVLGVVF